MDEICSQVVTVCVIITGTVMGIYVILELVRTIIRLAHIK